MLDPVYPVNVNITGVPKHDGVIGCEIEPATETGLTVTVTGVVSFGVVVHGLLVNTALNEVVCVKIPVLYVITPLAAVLPVKVAPVPVASDHVEPPSVDVIHFPLPTLPVANVKVVLDPVQIVVALAVTAFTTVAGLITNGTLGVVAVEQTPFLTIAWNK